MSDRMHISADVMRKAGMYTSAQLAYITWGTSFQDAALQTFTERADVDRPKTKEELVESIIALWLHQHIVESRAEAKRLLRIRN